MVEASLSLIQSMDAAYKAEYGLWKCELKIESFFVEIIHFIKRGDVVIEEVKGNGSVTTANNKMGAMRDEASMRAALRAKAKTQTDPLNAMR
jgi:nucleoside diphosphate kinase